MKGAGAHTRTISMAQWRALARENAAPPVTIGLEGDSMRPLIRRGCDPVTIVPVRGALRRGDVVLFTLGDGRYVVHRVWRLKDGFVRTLGDNCLNPEPWFPRAQVLGQVVRFSRNGHALRLDTPVARAFGRAWMALFPIRRRCRQLRALAGRGYRKLFPKREGN